jgi:hypothetical protein
MFKTIAVTLAVTFASACAFAQSLTLDPGYTQQSILDVQAVAYGFDLDSSGNVYYIGNQDSNPGDTQITEVTAASGYTSSSTVVDYNTFTYPSFLNINNSTLYYGDSSYINDTPLPVTSTVSPTLIATIPDNYDMAFSGTTAFVSANESGFSAPANGVYELNINTGVSREILSTDDYSGPIAFSSDGSLIYGASGATSNPGGADIYLFSAQSVQNALTSRTPLTYADATTVISGTGGNSDFAVIGNLLYVALNDYATSTSTLSVYDLDNPNAAPIQIGSAQEGYYFAQMQEYDGDLYVDETDGGSVSDFIEIAPIPEPGAFPLAIAGLILIAFLQRRRAPRETC